MEKSLATREFRVFTQLLRDTRKAAGVTQVELAEAVGQTQSYISKVERGECRLDIFQIRQFCFAMKTTLPEFIKQFESRLAQRRGAGRG